MRFLLFCATLLIFVPMTASAASDYFTMTPCRVLSSAPISGPPTTITLRGVCGVPLWATSVRANLTVIAPTQYGFVQVLPAGRSANTSTHNYRPGKTRSNNLTTALSAIGQISLSSSSNVNVHLDVTGYFGVQNSWRVVSSYPFSQFATVDYFGFPFAMQAAIPGGTLEVYTGNAVAANQDVCPMPLLNNIETVRTISGVRTTYLRAAGLAVNKLLFSAASQLFTDPATGTHYNGALYYETQTIKTCTGQDCYPNAKWAAYTNDGITFTPGRQLIQYCDLFAPCTSNWFCDNGFPCDSASPRQWYTGGLILPSVYVNGAFYALAHTYRVDRNDPDLPTLSNAQVWTMQSADGNTWAPYLQAYGGAIDPHFFQASCLAGPWLINQDMAYDPATDVYYFTRSYSDNYAGCSFQDYPGGTTLPNRLQLYSAQGATAFVNGTWTKLLDLGCGELGFQPDSAEIKHDGIGNVIHYGTAGLILHVGVSGASGTHTNCSGGSDPNEKGSCGTPPANRVQVVVVSP